MLYISIRDLFNNLMQKNIIEIEICENLHIKKNEDEVINERIKPKIWHWAYLGMKPLLKEIKNFSELADKNGAKKILDLGCGVKPYESLFSFSDKFVGTDMSSNSRADVLALNWDLPFGKDDFDALISTQVLEHTAKIFETVKEMKRVVKNNGLIFVSVPLTFPEHGIPFDYYRFTRYGLQELFKSFEIIKIIPVNGYLNTLFRMLNLFLHYLPGSNYYLFPLFAINNLVAIFLDKIVEFLKFFMSFFDKKKIIAEIYDKFYMGFTENYILIGRNKK